MPAVGGLDDLLTVQELDTRADQLRHRRSALGELEEVRAAGAALEEAEASASGVRDALSVLQRRQRDVEDEVAKVEGKAADVERKLYDGSVVAAKELGAYQDDHRLLKQRQSELEDQVLEVMEEAEPVAAELADLESVVAERRGALDAASTRLAEAQAVIDAELAEVDRARRAAAEAVPAEVLASYQALRERLGGIGVARLVGARCEGCHLEIPSAELEEVRRAPADELVTCPECGRLLAR